MLPQPGVIKATELSGSGTKVLFRLSRGSWPYLCQQLAELSPWQVQGGVGGLTPPITHCNTQALNLPGPPFISRLTFFSFLP